VSRTERIRPTGAALIIGAMIGALALAGCGAGQVAQTSRQVSAVGGANATVGTIAVRDAQIEFRAEAHGGVAYARGQNAPLLMSIVNTGEAPDRLVSGSSPVASTVQISGNTEIPGGQVLLVEGEPTASAEAAPTAVPAPGEAPATPLAPTPTASAGAGRTAQIVLSGLQEDIRAGLTYPLVLTFERAGEVRLEVPVGNATAPREDAHAG
jgi:hypothetical protein